jgi:acetyltransferase-like isoleucine patch superfamily enzyme
MNSEDNSNTTSRLGSQKLTQPGYWVNGELPENVLVGSNSIVTADYAFKRFLSKRNPALNIGTDCTMEGVHFAIGEDGRIETGNYCYFTNAVLLCELEIKIGSYVVIGWNTTIADTDFHPIAPAERVLDAIACSPLGKNLTRPEIVRKKVIIEDDVWIGPNATILKGVRIGTGAFIEAGTLVVSDIPPRSRVIGNPAQVIGKV